jgi:hypothetical protein
MVIQKLTTDIDKDKVVRNQEKENKKEKKNIMSSCSETYYPRLRTTVMLSYTCITYTSAARFFEGHLPHNTIIPDHDKRQTSPKMSTISPPQIPR